MFMITRSRTKMASPMHKNYSGNLFGISCFHSHTAIYFAWALPPDVRTLHPDFRHTDLRESHTSPAIFIQTAVHVFWGHTIPLCHPSERKFQRIKPGIQYRKRQTKNTKKEHAPITEACSFYCSAISLY